MNIKLTSIFLQIFEWLILIPQTAALSHWTWQFWNTEISPGSVATRLSVVECLTTIYCKFTSEPASEKNLEIGHQSYVQKSWFFCSQCNTI